MKYNPKDNPIVVKCQGADRLPLDAILEFQGNLKKLSGKNKDKLVSSICRLGFIAPVFVWDNQGDYSLLDGHQRTKTLIHMREQGWDIPMIPVVFIEADNEKDARAKLLAITSQYGEFEIQELKDWVSEFDLGLIEAFRFTDEELGVFTFNEDGTLAEEDEMYTAKVEAPIYEITGECPELSSLVDTTKADALASEIQAAQIPDEIKDFLLHAAHRHKVFSYDKIAEYYAHASEEVQNLMEKSALVIIDFDKAIEGGFVKLSEEIAKAYTQEESNDEE